MGSEMCIRDRFIGEPNYWNKGIGTEVMKKVIGYLVSDKEAQYVMVDPQCRNIRAIHCYEKCGFKKSKIVEEHELHEGKLESCCLMIYERR